MLSRRILFLLLIVLLLPHTHVTSDQNGENKIKLKLLSYNIRHTRGMDNRINLKRIADVIGEKKPDLVALQEVDRNCLRSGNKDIAADLGRLLGMEFRFAKFMDYDGGEYGMAVLSRLPIMESIRHPLPDGAEPRCALEVRVKVKDFSYFVSFICIHNDWTEESIRVNQVSALLSMLKGYSHPVILAGDFNGEREDRSMKLFENGDWRILDKGGEKTWPSDKPSIEIDFFVIRGFQNGLTYCKVMDEKSASDHKPIYAEIAYTGEEQAVGIK